MATESLCDIGDRTFFQRLLTREARRREGAGGRKDMMSWSTEGGRPP